MKGKAELNSPPACRTAWVRDPPDRSCREQYKSVQVVVFAGLDEPSAAYTDSGVSNLDLLHMGATPWSSTLLKATTGGFSSSPRAL